MEATELPDKMDRLAHQLFMPLAFVINYTLRECFVVLYWARRRELRVGLLFAVSVVGVSRIVPLARADPNIVRGLNDISESAPDHNYRIQSQYEIQSSIGLVPDAAILLSVATMAAPKRVNQQLAEDFQNICESTTLVFIICFRFYYIGIARGWSSIWRGHKIEF
uniref:Uncharacterized protein n=1 Tax=Globisporangium ultimum (strain ATCC 200006 / CBS 805.95 / DAOM BR144) TaxID=431595 RepID=K3WY36_GLOUD